MNARHLSAKTSRSYRGRTKSRGEKFLRFESTDRIARTKPPSEFPSTTMPHCSGPSANGHADLLTIAGRSQDNASSSASPNPSYREGKKKKSDAEYQRGISSWAICPIDQTLSSLAAGAPATRNKTKVDLVRPLSAAALAVLADMPRIDGRESVFWPSMRFASMKKLLDERSGVRDWVLHDLRRTARSLMSRAGVNADHAERCLGHTIGGVRGTYDRYAYYTEKKHAFEALAAQIERIVSLPSEDSQHILTRISELLDDR